MASSHKPRFDEYTVGWICALHIEAAAALGVLDGIIMRDVRGSNGDPNIYTLGQIGCIRVAITCLSGFYGTNSAADVGTNMSRTFKNLEYRFLVGIGGGVPNGGLVRLGDVVIGLEIVQFDLGKVTSDGTFQTTGSRSRPPPKALSLIQSLRIAHEAKSHKISHYIDDMIQRNPEMAHYKYHIGLQDSLFQGDDSREIIPRLRPCNDAKIHYGTIASGNQVMKNSKIRDDWALKLGNICFEMEAAGLQYNFPCVVIRGICDYSDRHKSKEWQHYAAATAAACAKEILLLNAIQNTEEDDPVQEIHSGLILQSLQFEEQNDRYKNIRPAFRSTCSWFLYHAKYQAWLDWDKYKQHGGVLWIKGKPGAGKSTLVKYIYDDIGSFKDDNQILISFFFNARGTDLEHSIAGMYRALIFQLISELPSLQHILDDTRFRDYSTLDSQREWSLVDLRYLLMRAISNLGTAYITCLIDALDECPEDDMRELLCDDLPLFSETAIACGTKFYVCLSSRYYPNIDIPRSLQFELDTAASHDRDIWAYISAKLSTLRGKAGDDLRQEIVRKASGTFIWVVLVVNILKKDLDRGKKHQIRTKLSQIPSELSDLFADILQRDQEDMGALVQCLQLVLFSSRPLRCEEFYYALLAGLDEGDNGGQGSIEPWDPESITPRDMRLFILHSSKGLVQVSKTLWKTVQVIHESVRDFVLKSATFAEIHGASGGNNFSALSHIHLENCCLRYCNLDYRDFEGVDFETYAVDSETYSSDEGSGNGSDDESNSSEEADSDDDDEFNSSGEADSDENESRNSQDMLKRDPSDHDSRSSRGQRMTLPFLDYAIHNVFYHAKMAADDISQRELFSDFPLIRWIELNNIVDGHNSSSLSPIMLLKAILRRDATKLLDKGSSSNASFELQPELVKQDYIPGTNHRLSTQLETIHRNDKGLSSILQDFFNSVPSSEFHNLDPNLLNCAVESGLVSIVEALAEGATRMTGGGVGGSPLFFAARNGHDSLVELLLELGFNTEIKYPYFSQYQTPLSVAAQKGHESVVRMLLENGQFPQDDDVRESSTFCLAAGSGSNSIVQLLIRYGFNINERDSDNDTPLVFAAAAGHMSIVDLLLDNGATLDTHAVEEAGVTGRLHMVRHLLEFGCDIDSIDMMNLTSNAILFQNRHHSIDILQLLIKYGVSFHDWSYTIFLDMTTTLPTLHLVKLLLDAGADFSKLLQRILLFAVSKNEKILIELFLVSCKSILRQQDIQEAIGKAQSLGFVDIVDVFQQYLSVDGVDQFETLQLNDSSSDSGSDSCELTD